MSRTKFSILKLFRGCDGDNGLWLGNPHPETVKKYCEVYGFLDFEAIRIFLGDNCRWLMGEEYAYYDPEGKTLFEAFLQGKQKPLEGCVSVSEVEKYPWPNPDHLRFDSLRKALLERQEYVRFSGMWTPFFHLLCDLFGMEQYFINMYLRPAVVQAATEKIVDFYLEANKRCFEECRGEIDVFFFGNDFGTQIDLLISPEMFKKFVLPYLRKIVDLAKSYNVPVMLHSCGAIAKIIPFLIDIGIDALHPLQARARGMDAETLAKNFKGKLTFVGGVDTQELLVYGSPEEVRQEVLYLRKTFGGRYIVSPSHEAVLPNVPFENIEAMARAAFEPI